MSTPRSPRTTRPRAPLVTLEAHRRAMQPAPTQADVGRRMQTLGGLASAPTQATVSRWLAGTRPVPRRLAPLLAAALGVALEDVVLDIEDDATVRAAG